MTETGRNRWKGERQEQEKERGNEKKREIEEERGCDKGENDEVKREMREVYIYIYINIYTYIYTHTHTYIFIYIYACMYVCIYRMVEEWVLVCLLAPSPWTLGPSGAPSPSPLLSSGSPRPRTQGRRPQPRYRRLLVAFAVLPSPLSITRALLALSFRREGAPVSHKLPLCVPVREPFRRVTYYTHTHAARFERGRIDFKERRERERVRVGDRGEKGFSLHTITVAITVVCSGLSCTRSLSISLHVEATQHHTAPFSSCSLFLPRFDQFSRTREHARCSNHREIYGGRRIVVTRSAPWHTAARASRCICVLVNS